MRILDHVKNAFNALRLSCQSRPNPREFKKILVIGYGAIGDTIFFLPVLELLRSNYPQAQIVWLSNPSPITDELIPATELVNEVWKWEAQNVDAKGRHDINLKIISAQFDLAVLTLGAPAHYFLTSLYSIPTVIGHQLPWQGLKRFIILGSYVRHLVLNKPVLAFEDEHVIKRNVRVLDTLQIHYADPSPKPALPIPAKARERAKELLSTLSGSIIALHLGPNPNQYHKMWGPEKFASLSNMITNSVILVGSPDEKASQDTFHLTGGKCALDLIGKTSLTELFAVLEKCSLVVSNDTGVAKAAAAIGVPTITIWGPTNPQELGILWESAKHQNVRTGISCSPCVQFSSAVLRSPNYLNCGHYDCLGKLEAEVVHKVIVDNSV